MNLNPIDSITAHLTISHVTGLFLSHKNSNKNDQSTTFTFPTTLTMILCYNYERILSIPLLMTTNHCRPLEFDDVIPLKLWRYKGTIIQKQKFELSVSLMIRDQVMLVGRMSIVMKENLNMWLCVSMDIRRKIIRWKNYKEWKFYWEGGKVRCRIDVDYDKISKNMYSIGESMSTKEGMDVSEEGDNINQIFFKYRDHEVSLHSYNSKDNEVSLQDHSTNLSFNEKESSDERDKASSVFSEENRYPFIHRERKSDIYNVPSVNSHRKTQLILSGNFSKYRNHSVDSRDIIFKSLNSEKKSRNNKYENNPIYSRSGRIYDLSNESFIYGNDSLYPKDSNIHSSLKKKKDREYEFKDNSISYQDNLIYSLDNRNPSIREKTKKESLSKNSFMYGSNSIYLNDNSNYSQVKKDLPLNEEKHNKFYIYGNNSKYCQGNIYLSLKEHSDVQSDLLPEKLLYENNSEYLKEEENPRFYKNDPGYCQNNKNLSLNQKYKTNPNLLPTSTYNVHLYSQEKPTYAPNSINYVNRIYSQGKLVSSPKSTYRDYSLYPSTPLSKSDKSSYSPGESLLDSNEHLKLTPNSRDSTRVIINSKQIDDLNNVCNYDFNKYCNKTWYEKNALQQEEAKYEEKFGIGKYN